MRFGFRSFAAVAACVAALGASSATMAAPTLVGTTSNPIGFDGLVVDGTTYNVTFSTTTLNTFTQGTTLSTDATTQLVAALNALGVTELASQSGINFFLVTPDNSTASFDAAGCQAAYASCGLGTWGSVSTGSVPLGLSDQNPFTNDTYYVEAADFSVVSTTTGVPEPLTLSLFGAGLAGAVAMRRRKSIDIK